VRCGEHEEVVELVGWRVEEEPLLPPADPEVRSRREERVVFGDPVAPTRHAGAERLDRGLPRFVGRERVEERAGGKSL
jgi:hypothetical protein